MINGNPNDFLEHVYTCQDMEFVFQGIKYCFDGYNTAELGAHMEIFQIEPVPDPWPLFLWQHSSEKLGDCYEAFLNAPIFAGRTFWDAERDIEWTL